ncbi:glycosyltransferase family A protein [uncultured Microbacterium sp.]|uniref:glycosyltransferase family A protein n=1 Tax=uncultured Microbacterium sp. TaxID=191216 RepID=UPI0028D833A2|nr:glycosyltransferase family A protein [uncultured Microbacterium sp.]
MSTASLVTAERAPRAPSAQPRVSVVVPVFRPGAGIDELIASLDRQTLPASQFEVLLCDDGSGDSTLGRLEQIAAARPHVRVLPLSHTGWPGTPRNHGIDAASGMYVFFADQDDRLFEGALQRLCDYADEQESDVVIGRVVGVGRPIPRAIFRRDVPQAVLGTDPLLELLTPHKLFRTEFLRRNAIRFPDGRVRLEDHLFVMKAYFTAGTISILASAPCYAWLKNKGSASSSRIDPATYFPHLERVLDLVEENTEPGALRDDLLRHWYRGKILSRLGGRRMLRYPDDYRARFLDVVVPIVRSRFSEAVERELPLPLRVRSVLLRHGHRDQLLRLAEFEAAMTCEADVASVRWTRLGKLVLTVRYRFVRGGEDALLFSDAADSTTDAGRPGVRPVSQWRPPEGLAEVLDPAILDATGDLQRDHATLAIRDPSGEERRVRGRMSLGGTTAAFTIDPVHLYARGDRSAGGALVTRVRHAGWSFDAPLTADPAMIARVRRSPLLAGRTVELRSDPEGTVEMRRGGPHGRRRDAVARAARRAWAFARSASRALRASESPPPPAR